MKDLLSLNISFFTLVSKVFKGKFGVTESQWKCQSLHVQGINNQLPHSRTTEQHQLFKQQPEIFTKTLSKFICTPNPGVPMWKVAGAVLHSTVLLLTPNGTVPSLPWREGCHGICISVGDTTWETSRSPDHVSLSPSGVLVQCHKMQSSVPKALEQLQGTVSG